MWNQKKGWMTFITSRLTQHGLVHPAPPIKCPVFASRYKWCHERSKCQRGFRQPVLSVLLPLSCLPGGARAQTCVPVASCFSPRLRQRVAFTGCRDTRCFLSPATRASACSLSCSWGSQAALRISGSVTPAGALASPPMSLTQVSTVRLKGWWEHDACVARWSTFLWILGKWTLLLMKSIFETVYGFWLLTDAWPASGLALFDMTSVVNIPPNSLSLIFVLFLCVRLRRTGRWQEMPSPGFRGIRRLLQGNVQRRRVKISPQIRRTRAGHVLFRLQRRSRGAAGVSGRLQIQGGAREEVQLRNLWTGFPHQVLPQQAPAQSSQSPEDPRGLGVRAEWHGLLSDFSVLPSAEHVAPGVLRLSDSPVRVRLLARGRRGGPEWHRLWRKVTSAFHL